MRIERLLAKFNIKGINYEPNQGGRGLLSVEEQLAIVGFCWKDAPVGWLVLFVEGLSDVHALKLLQTATLAEINREMEHWRGTYPEKALDALCLTAIAEATQQHGQLCPECRGTGRTTNKYRVTRQCPACKDGRVPWTNETRFAKFAQVLPVPYSRFKRYKPVLENVVQWLISNRTTAMLAIQERMEREVREAEVA